VYRTAHERLTPEDAPIVMYLEAECLSKMGEREEAQRKYLLAQNTARNLKSARVDGLKFIGPDHWAQLAAERFKDHEDGF